MVRKRSGAPRWRRKSTLWGVLPPRCDDGVARSIEGTRAWVERFAQARTLSPHPGKILVFPISGGVFLEGGGEPLSLHTWDLAVVSATDRVMANPGAQGDGRAPGESAAPLVFFAALDDNSPWEPV